MSKATKYNHLGNAKIVATIDKPLQKGEYEHFLYVRRLKYQKRKLQSF